MADRARLYIERAHLGRGLHVEVQATGAARRALGALAAFLRTLPLWAGGTGALIMSIADTTIIGEAFRPGTQLTSWMDIEALAGIAWFLPDEFRGGELRRAEWLAIIRPRMDEHLRQLAKEPPVLPFPEEDPR